MDTSKLAERLRGVLRADVASAQLRISGPVPEVGVPLRAPGGRHAEGSLESILGGEWRSSAQGRCFIVERRAAPDRAYGRGRIGDIADGLDRNWLHASLLTAGGSAPRPLVFFDLETTGLSGGAGTWAFLIGFGWFAGEGGFATRQYLLVGDERAMLGSVAVEFQNAGTLVSFNGKSFDAPMLETRYLFQRLDWPAATLPHLDVLHPARRFWGRAMTDRWDRQGVGLTGFVRDEDACSLGGLERRVLGAGRRGDVPGFEIPACYFRFVRSRDARALVGVLEHNRLDLLGLAGLTANVLRLVGGGADEASDGREALALGRLYERARDGARARRAYEKALDSGAAVIVAEASRALALLDRRARRHDHAAIHWRRVLDSPGCPDRMVSEASEALAVHHEHRVRDLEAAKAFALRSVNESTRPRRAANAHHRLARLERKLDEERALLS